MINFQAGLKNKKANLEYNLTGLRHIKRRTKKYHGEIGPLHLLNKNNKDCLKQ